MRCATLPRVSEAIQIFGVRFFNQLALTVAQSCIAFAAAGGDAPTRPMQAKRITGAVGDQRRLRTAVVADKRHRVNSRSEDVTLLL
jgi:hypothetical protein